MPYTVQHMFPLLERKIVDGCASRNNTSKKVQWLKLDLNEQDTESCEMGKNKDNVSNLSANLRT